MDQESFPHGSYCGGINDRDLEVLEILSIEGEDSRDSIRIHGRDKPGIVSTKSSHFIGADDIHPSRAQIFTIHE